MELKRSKLFILTLVFINLNSVESILDTTYDFSFDEDTGNVLPILFTEV